MRGAALALIGGSLLAVLPPAGWSLLHDPSPSYGGAVAEQLAEPRPATPQPLPPEPAAPPPPAAPAAPPPPGIGRGSGRGRGVPRV